MRRADRHGSRAPRLSAARRSGRPRPPDAVLRGGPLGAGRFRRRHRAHDHRRAREPGFPLSLDCAARRCRRRQLRAQCVRARLAALVLSLEPRSGRRAAAPRGVGRARPTGSARRPGQTHARRSARSGARDELRAALAQRRRPRRRATRQAAVPGVHRGAAPRLCRGDRAIRRQRPARGPKRPDVADGRLHFFERASCAPLRCGGSRRPAVSPRRADRRPAPRAAR